jgi:NAD(P)H-dependent flavin oxidoreductase YrpB (nitropropane dioxygenase family)
VAFVDPGPQGSSTGGFASILSEVSQGVEAGISTASLAQAQQAAQGLKDSASSGQIRITEYGFNILMDAITQCYTHLADLRKATYMVKQAPQLGTSPYAQTVSAHVQKGGTGSTQSADMVVEQLNEVLDMTRDALNQAKKNYEDTEHGNVQVLK